jgi:hypothetical protein
MNRSVFTYTVSARRGGSGTKKPPGRGGLPDRVERRFVFAFARIYIALPTTFGLRRAPGHVWSTHGRFVSRHALSPAFHGICYVVLRPIRAPCSFDRFSSTFSSKRSGFLFNL